MSRRQHDKARTSARPALPPLDVQVLQTAASLENLAVTAYESAARLAFAEHGYPALATFVARTKAQHQAHAAAFNAAAAKAGGAAQHAADPRYAASVHAALKGVADPAALASLLGSLEDVNAQSCTRYAALASSHPVRSLFVSVAIDEAAHRSFLLAALQLLTTGPTGLVRFPTVPDQLPAVIGTECFPHAFYPTADASAIDEGAVR
jgi:Ferritin-like domain